MYILLISLVVSLTIGLLSFSWLGMVAAIVPFTIVFVLCYYLLTRKVNAQLEFEMQAIQKDLQKGPKHIDAAVKKLERIRDRFKNWQFFTEASLNGQIGSLFFMQQKFKEAQPFLEKSFARLWNTQVMLAVLQNKKKDSAAMNKTLEKAVKYSPKQGLLWSTWAYLHMKNGSRDKAISVLVRGKEFLKEQDQVLSDNLLALQNGKKMKMKGYGEAWYQFHLEQHPMMRKAQRGNVRFTR